MSDNTGRRSNGQEGGGGKRDTQRAHTVWKHGSNLGKRSESLALNASVQIPQLGHNDGDNEEGGGTDDIIVERTNELISEQQAAKSQQNTYESHKITQI